MYALLQSSENGYLSGAKRFGVRAGSAAFSISPTSG
jgi:hypothetical protein